MAWSNSIPPQIQTLNDGSTLFNGPINVEDANGNTVAGIGTDGTINGSTGNFSDIKLSGNSLNTTIADLASGAIASYQLSGTQTFTINNGNAALVMLTNGYQTVASRTYEWIMNSFVALTSVSGDNWYYELCNWNSYPTSATWFNNRIILSRGVAQANSSGALTFPQLYANGTWGNNTTYTGLVVYRNSGTGTWIGDLSYSSFRIQVNDLGTTPSNTGGIYNPIPYAGGTPPAPPKTQYSKSYFPAYTMAYQQSGVQYNNNGQVTTHMYQGAYDSIHGISGSYFNFNRATLMSDLTGSVAVSSSLYVYCMHSWYTSGMTLGVNLIVDSGTTAPATWNGAGPFYGYYDVPNPGWVQIPISNTLYTQLANGTYSGFSLFVNDTSLQHYGYCAGNLDANSPHLDIVYQK